MHPPPTAPAAPLRLAAVVLTGGTGARLGGTDKATLEVAGVSLLERSLAAVMAAAEVVVVGPETPTSAEVTWAREEPAGGGPAAGLLAGVDALILEADLLVVLAVDMPRVNSGTVARLTWAVEGDASVDGAVLVDGTGRRQSLAAVYRASALASARPRDRNAESGLPMHRLVGDLRLREVPVVGDEARDVDTAADLVALSELD